MKTIRPFFRNPSVDVADTWGLQRMLQRPCIQSGSLSGLELNATGQNVNIYVVDSGINDHVELESLFQSQKIQVLHDSFGTGGKDFLGHGTAVTSLIAGDNIGFACDANILNVKVFNESLKVEVSSVLAGLQSVVNHLKTLNLGQVRNQTSLVCLAWTAPASELIEALVESIYEQGAIIVTAAGDLGKDILNFTPARLSYVITMGSVDQNDETPLQFNPSEHHPNILLKPNFGTQIDFYAPGFGIDVASFSNPTGYDKLNGSSLACAYASGLIACVLEEKRFIAFHELKCYLDESSTIINSGPNAKRILCFLQQSLGPKWIQRDSVLGVFCDSQEVEIDIQAVNSISDEPIFHFSTEQVCGLIVQPSGKITGKIKTDTNDLPLFCSIRIGAENRYGTTYRDYLIVITERDKMKLFEKELRQSAMVGVKSCAATAAATASGGTCGPVGGTNSS